jgi:hypothetical protein
MSESANRHCGGGRVAKAIEDARYRTQVRLNTAVEGSLAIQLPHEPTIFRNLTVNTTERATPEIAPFVTTQRRRLSGLNRLLTRC